MHCHLCDREAVDRCYTCGELFCAEHGKVDCVRCATGIIAGDNRRDRISRSPGSTTSKPAWWRPKEAEDYDPPACHECQGLARYICVECRNRYCREHAGKNGLCRVCQEAQRGSNVVLLLMFLLLAGLIVLGLLRGWAGP